MSLQDKNLIKIYKEIYALLPSSSFVLSLKTEDTTSNILFVSILPIEKFLSQVSSLLTKKFIKYEISEDVLLLKFKSTIREIAYIPIDLYEERITPRNLSLNQSRSTSWSIGPWIIEGFWSNILSSTKLYGERNLKLDKYSIEKNCPRLLEDYLTKEIKNKKFLYKKNDFTELEQEILLQDLRIAMIRKLFIKNCLFLRGIKDISSKKLFLSQSDLHTLELLTNISNDKLIETCAI